jgi:hypothetical protein
MPEGGKTFILQALLACLLVDCVLKLLKNPDRCDCHWQN